MFDLTIKNILANTWPMILIITIILSSLRIAYLLKYHEKFKFYEEMLKLGFIIYIMSLFYVVTFQDVSWSTSNFIPFKEVFRYQIFSERFFRNVVGNLIMFMPYGFFVSYFLGIIGKLKDSFNWLKYFSPFDYYDPSEILKDGFEVKFIIIGNSVIIISWWNIRIFCLSIYSPF